MRRGVAGAGHVHAATTADARPAYAARDIGSRRPCAHATTAGHIA